MLEETFVTSWIKKNEFDLSSIKDKYIDYINETALTMLFPINNIYDVMIKIFPYKYYGKEFKEMSDACIGCITTTSLGRIFTYFNDVDQHGIMSPFISADATEQYIWDFIKSNYFAVNMNSNVNRMNTLKTCHPCPLNSKWYGSGQNKYTAEANKYAYCKSFSYNTRTVNVTALDVRLSFLIKRDTKNYNDFNDFESNAFSDPSFPFKQYEDKATGIVHFHEITPISTHSNLVNPGYSAVSDPNKFSSKYIASSNGISINNRIRWNVSQFERTNHLWTTIPMSLSHVLNVKTFSKYINGVEDYKEALVHRNSRFPITRLSPCAGCASFHEVKPSSEIALYPFLTLLHRPQFYTLSSKVDETTEEDSFFDYGDFDI